LARGLTTKHAIKQVDRMLSNQGIDIDAALRHWVPYVVGPRTSINVAIACPREGGGTGPSSMPTAKPPSCCHC
jgi:hypothetical protein